MIIRLGFGFGVLPTAPLFNAAPPRGLTIDYSSFWGPKSLFEWNVAVIGEATVILWRTKQGIALSTWQRVFSKTTAGFIVFLTRWWFVIVTAHAENFVFWPQKYKKESNNILLKRRTDVAYKRAKKNWDICQSIS